MPINIDTKGVPFEAPLTDSVYFSYKDFEYILNAAKVQFVVSEENLKKIALLDDYVIEHFRIAFGNRIVKQLRDFVPAYVGTGGTELDGLDYVLVGDYYVPDLKLPEEHRPIGMWGRLHRTYLEQYRPTRFSALCLSGELHTYLADLDEQATERCSLIIEQMKQAEGVTETMKADNQMLWVQSMNSIRNRAEEIIRQEMIYC